MMLLMFNSSKKEGRKEKQNLGVQFSRSNQKLTMPKLQVSEF